jgi:hypothetical protein
MAAYNFKSKYVVCLRHLKIGERFVFARYPNETNYIYEYAGMRVNYEGPYPHIVNFLDYHSHKPVAKGEVFGNSARVVPLCELEAYKAELKPNANTL